MNTLRKCILIGNTVSFIRVRDDGDAVPFIILYAPSPLLPVTCVNWSIKEFTKGSSTGSCILSSSACFYCIQR